MLSDVTGTTTQLVAPASLVVTSIPGQLNAITLLTMMSEVSPVIIRLV